MKDKFKDVVIQIVFILCVWLSVMAGATLARSSEPSGQPITVELALVTLVGVVIGTFIGKWPAKKSDERKGRTESHGKKEKVSTKCKNESNGLCAIGVSSSGKCEGHCGHFKSPRKACPKCGGNKFIVTWHVTQTVKVDDEGSFLEPVTACDEVTHSADDDDIWTCDKCGYEAAGSEFDK